MIDREDREGKQRTEDGGGKGDKITTDFRGDFSIDIRE